MGKRLFRFLILVLAMLLILGIALNVQAKEKFKKIRCTYYIDTGYCKDGTWTVDGVVAMNDDMLGKTVNLYRYNANGKVGELIGTYEVHDTGSHPGLKNGTRIDVWKASDEEGKAWVAEYGDYVFMEILEDIKK